MVVEAPQYHYIWYELLFWLSSVSRKLRHLSLNFETRTRVAALIS
jgi:hypothetical protein